MLYLTVMKKEELDSVIWDLVIIGGGPAGTTAAMVASGNGYRVALIDKAKFPRDKICGDACSPDVVQQLVRIAPSLVSKFDALPPKQKIKGLKVYSPNRNLLCLEFKTNQESVGYVVSRMDLDSMLMEEVKERGDIHVFEETEVRDIQRVENRIKISTSSGSFETKLVIGADGNHSLVAKTLGGRKQIDRKHHCAALRQYYENVTWPEGKEHIELHFIDDVLPGYLWVFPMSGNRANVGIGMLSDHVSKNKVNLKNVLDEQLKSHSEIAPRFADAKPMESVKGFGIPIGSKKYTLVGDNYMLVGDAACLVDPLSGEGIANAIRSGRFSGKFALEALANDQYSASSLKAYEEKIYSMVWDEFRLSRFIQRSFRNRKVINFALGLGMKSKSFRRMLHLLFEETNFFTDWAKPSYYLKLMQRKKTV